MVNPKVASYGAWESPITSDLIVSKSIGLSAVGIQSEAVYWLELRPSERGRYVLVKQLNDRSTIDINPPPYNVRTRVHEYGGGALVIYGDIVYFSNFTDQRVYKVNPGSSPVPITPEGALRYADYVVDSQRQRIICIREDHREEALTKNNNEPINSIVALNLDGSGQQVELVTGNDFYSSPRLKHDGQQLAWLTWNHPNMPWDGTQLWLADVSSEGQLSNPELVAGGLNESIFQPEWSPDGILTFVSDRTGWWNIYRYERNKINCVLEMQAEYGVPQWQFGFSTYAYISLTEIACIYTKDGKDYLSLLDVNSGQQTPIDIPYSSLSSIKAAGQILIFRGAAPDRHGAVLLYDLTSESLSVVKESTTLQIEPTYISVPKSISYPTSENRNAYALYYAPKNPDFVAPEGEKPPLIVISHGGPTSRTKSSLSLSLQYWTSRGFAVLDVNYGGSTGYGREYRQCLQGKWGIVDVDDCANGAIYLSQKGFVDKKRLIIKGGSAGGYTTLAALCFKNVFNAGASYFGVSDLEALALDTHKFESRYLDGLIGPYPQSKLTYIERSPIHNVKGLSCPMIFFQGDEDRVVPPDQARKMVDALVEKGLPVAYILFEGEQHGFRQADSVKRALDAELYFYGRIFNFNPANHIDPVEIINLDKSSAKCDRMPGN